MFEKRKGKLTDAYGSLLGHDVVILSFCSFVPSLFISFVSQRVFFGLHLFFKDNGAAYFYSRVVIGGYYDKGILGRDGAGAGYRFSWSVI